MHAFHKTNSWVFSFTFAGLRSLWGEFWNVCKGLATGFANARKSVAPNNISEPSALHRLLTARFVEAPQVIETQMCEHSLPPLLSEERPGRNLETQSTIRNDRYYVKHNQNTNNISEGRIEGPSPMLLMKLP